MLSKEQVTLSYKRNIKIYEITSYLNAGILIWGVMTLYYAFKGLSFFEISLLQSIGSVFVIILEIPFGWISDRYGHSIVLKASALFRLIFVVFLIIFDGFFLLLISEFFSSLATASQSGADTALFYDSLIKTEQKEDYVKIKAKIRGRQSLIRIFSRLIAPLSFSILGDLPFVISFALYLLITILTIKYTNPSKPTIRDESSRSNDTEKNELKSKFVNLIMKHKLFIIYSLLSAFVLVSVSNYSNFPPKIRA